MKAYKLYILKDLFGETSGEKLGTLASEKEFIRSYDTLEEAISVAKSKGYRDCPDDSIVAGAVWHSDFRTINIQSYMVWLEAMIEEVEY